MDLKSKEEKRKNNLQKILTKLENGNHVQNRTLETWLTKDEFKTIQEMWDEQKELRKNLIEESKPEEILIYQKRFKNAEFAYNKANNYSLKKNHIAAKAGIRDANIQFESLLEFLEEILSADTSLYQWFDRPIIFNEFGREPSIDPVGMPRVKSFFDYNFQFNQVEKLTINQVKQHVVKTAIHDINYLKNKPKRTTKQKEEQEKKLKLLFANLRKSSRK